MHFSKSSVYEGGLVDSKRHGIGVMNWADGSAYEGEWLYDNRHGQGHFIWANGDVYEGKWMYGKRHGKGVLKWADGHVYEGDWSNGERHGKGVMKWADGSAYEGEWMYDNCHGQGRHAAETGDVYNGEWVEGKVHGTGTLSKANGDSFEQGYNNGKLLFSKQRVPYERIKVIDEYSNQSSSCTEEVVAVLALKNSDIECSICYKRFATNLYSKNESAQKLLPVVGTCLLILVWYRQICYMFSKHRPASSQLPAIARHNIIIEVQWPDGYVCPISHDIMHDPVICADGHSYERVNIERWLTKHNTSPRTGLQLPDNGLIPNHALRNAIEEWSANNN